MLKPSEAKKLSRLYVDAAGDITPRHLSDLEIWRWLAFVALIGLRLCDGRIEDLIINRDVSAAIAKPLLAAGLSHKLK